MRFTTFLILGFFLTAATQSAQATSQWSRKYKRSCQSCHTAFPRLNYFGEKFMKNGYQDPDNSIADGGTLRKKTYGDLDLNTYIGDFLGVRVDINAVKYQSNHLAIDDKKTASSLDLGKFGWAQIFAAGSISKNISFFNEIEYGGTGTLKHGWARLGFHNIFDTTAVNLYVGKLSPADFTVHSDRLRLLSVKGLAIGRKSSLTGGATTAEAESSPRDGQYGLQYYGYKNGLTWALGSSNGGETSDNNGELNHWASLMWQSQADNSFEGSGLSLMYYAGTDTANSGSGGSNQITNDFNRIIPGLNIRFKDWDIIASYTVGEDDNDGLTSTAKKTEFNGKTIIVSKMLSSKHHAGIQYDDLRYDDPDQGNADQERLTLRYSCFLKENVALHFLLDRDLLGKNDANDANKKYHASTFTLNLRTMF